MELRPKLTTPNKLEALRQARAARQSMSRSSSEFDMTEPDEMLICGDDHSKGVRNSPFSECSTLILPTEEIEEINQSSPNPPTEPLFAQKHLLGPDKPISDRLRGLLVDWHQVYPNTQPSCSLRSRPASWSPFKVFDQEGDEFELSVHEVSFKTPRKNLTYLVVIIHPHNGPADLVALGGIRPPPCESGLSSSYFGTWQGTAEEFEAEACAVRVWSRDHNKEKIVFNPACFDRADGDIQPWRTATSVTYMDPGLLSPKTPNTAFSRAKYSPSQS